MKPKTMILLFVAVGCGLVASILTSRLIAERSATPPPENRVKVLVAKQKILQYSLLKEPETLFVEKDLPEDAVPKKAIRSLDELKDKRINRQLSEDNFVTTDDLVSKDLNGLAAELAPGSRAVAIRVNPESLAGGFVLPNSRVDVVWVSRRGDADSLAQIILQNMLILAVDQINSRDPDRHSILGSTVTLAATPEEAQRLSVASATGDLRLFLRGIGDKEPVRLKGARVTDLTKPLRDPAGDGDEEDPEAVAGGPGLVPPLPPLPATPTGGLPPVQVQAQPEKVAVAEPEPLKHTMTLITGESVQRVVFVKGKDETWTSSSPDGERRAARPRTAPRPALGTAVPPTAPVLPPSGPLSEGAPDGEPARAN